MSEIKRLFIGGDGTTFPVVEQGANFIGIPDRRFEWAEWDGATDAETHEKTERLSGRDIAGIAQLTADAEGRIALDKTNGPDGKFMCVVWAADGRARFLHTLKVTEYGADETQTRLVTLPRQEPQSTPTRQEPAKQVQDESPLGNSCQAETTAEKETVVVEAQEVAAVESQETSNAEAWEMWHRLDERLARIEVGVNAGNTQGAEILKHAKSIPAFKQSLHDAMEKPYQLAAHLWQISMQIDAKWMPLFKAMVKHHANYTHAAEELSTPEKPYLQGTLWKQWNTHIKPIFTKFGGVDIDVVLAPRPDRVNKAAIGNEIPKEQD